jgi:Mannosyltransferase (PIG-V)
VARRIHAPAVRDAAVALVASRALVWTAGVSAWLLFRLSGDVRFDHDGLTHSFGSVGNALAAPAVRWDSNWYVDIAQHGYRHESVEPAFFPLYPLLMRGLGEVVGSVVVAGVAISLAAFFVALVLLHRLTELELGPEVARRAPLLLALFPTSLFFSAVYTEALFLALELGAFVAARRGRWALAGALGGLGAATRNTGWLLAPVLLALYLYGPRGDPPPQRAPGRAARWRPRYPLRGDVLWIGLVPLGLAGYLIFMQVHFGDLLAPWHAQAHFRRVFEGPLSAYWHGAEKAWDGVTGIFAGDPFGPAARKIGQFAVITGALAATVGVLRRLPAAYGLYALLSIVPVLSFPYPPGPLASSLRYVVVIFPLFMWLALRLRDRRAYVATVVVFAAMLVYSAGMFATWHFVA